MTNIEALVDKNLPTFKKGFNKTKDFLNKHKSKINKLENYVLIPAVAVASLPAATCLLLRKSKYDFENKLCGLGISLIASVLLDMGMMNFMAKDSLYFQMSNSKIIQRNVYEVFEEASTFKAISTSFLTNRYLSDIVINGADKVTTLKVSTKFGDNKLEGVYIFDGHKSLEYFKNLDLPKPEHYKFGTTKIKSDIKNPVFENLCKKEFEAIKLYLNASNSV